MTDLTWVLSSCMLILIVMWLRVVFGKRLPPGLRYALWGVVLLRLLVPTQLFAAPWGVSVELPRWMTEERIIGPADAGVEAPAQGHGEKNGVFSPDPEDGETRDRLTDNRTAEIWGDTEALTRARPETTEESRKRPYWSIADILLLIWRTGIGITAVVFLISNLRFYAQLHQRRKPVSIACPLRVYAVEGLASSCLFGNAVYISPEMETEAQKQRHILAHELSHFAHGDFFWSLMRCAVLALHWYNPLVWWAAALARQDSELWADAGALKQLGERERKNYGATLIELSARPRDKVPLLRTAISMSNGKRALIERVTMIAQRQRLNAHAVVAVIGIAAVAAGCAFAGEQQLQMTGANEPPEPTLQMAAVENEPMNAPEIDPLPPEKESNQAEPAQSSVVWDADLDGDGLMERIIVDTPSLDPGGAAGIWLEDSEGHRICDLGEVGLAHVGWRTLALTEQSGKTYLLEYSPGMFQGDAKYSYAIRELRHGELADVEHWEVAFNGNPEAQKYNSAEAIESFEKRANDVWAHSRLLITTDQEVLAHLYDAYTGERLKIESRYYITREGETIRYYETMLGLPEDGADTHSAG